MKNYINLSILYSVLAMIGGVFYREFTRFNHFDGKTVLSLVHTHYFMLGMIFFIILLLLENNFSFSNSKTNIFLILYNIGLNITVVMLVVRGIIQILELSISNSFNAAISGVAGIGHILLGISMFVILLQIKKSILK